MQESSRGSDSERGNHALDEAGYRMAPRAEDQIAGGVEEMTHGQQGGCHLDHVTLSNSNGHSPLDREPSISPPPDGGIMAWSMCKKPLKKKRLGALCETLQVIDQ